MRGAKEYAGLFKSPEQVGRLLIWPGNHARGHTLGIWVLPEGEQCERWGNSSVHIKGSYVKVYDAVSGQRGWTETYGWLHRGPWVDDFNKLVEERRAARDSAKLAREAASKIKEAEAHDRMMALLGSYKAEMYCNCFRGSDHETALSAVSTALAMDVAAALSEFRSK